MGARIQLYLWMAVLVLLGLGSAAYKHLSLGFPLTPGAQQTVWTVEARIQFRAAGGPVELELNLPDDTESLVVIEADAASPGYGFQRTGDGAEPTGVWAARERGGLQTVYYRVDVVRGNGEPRPSVTAPPGPPPKPAFREPRATAADAILEDAYLRSANAESFTVRLIEIMAAEDVDANIQTFLRGVEDERDRNRLLIDLLHSADVPARLVLGVELTEVGRRQAFHELVEVWDGEQWIVIDPRTGEQGLSETFLPWQRGESWMVQLEGGEDTRTSISVRANERAARSVALNLGLDQHVALIDFSIATLPVNVQNTFATLLLIPIGALVVVVLRNLVGIKTSGTFMPILIALAFVQTTLLTGLVLFLLIVSTGLMIRGYLSRLNLLLVPRIAAVLIVVITLYVAVSIVGHKMGVAGALSVTLFPMIIVSWTIERMSVLWEEEGANEVLVQGGGSLLTATIAYLVMTERHVEYLFFAFPELLLVVLALILAIGQYTGYRLSELRRFEPLARDG